MHVEGDPPRADPGDPRIGVLLGAAIGDALGTSHEFSSPRPIPYPALASGPQVGLQGGGPFAVEPGQVTDDTQMAVALARSLAAEPRYGTASALREYRRWVAVPPFDIGGTTYSSLRKGTDEEPSRGGRMVWEASGRLLAPNGSLMRSWVLGVAFRDDPEARREASLLDSAITHFDPLCRLACAAYNTAISQAVLGGSPADCLAAATGELDASARLLLRLHPDLAPVIDDRHASAARDLDLARQDDPGLYGTETHLLEFQGHVRVAFRLGFWHLLHSTGYKESLLDIANRGGDSDTNACIAGALLGARFGVGGIPEDWVKVVQGAVSGNPDSPWWKDYHPRLLPSLLGLEAPGTRT
jgi:ADP-ribosyl-[dinitrogen reductase] hydrolase